MGGKFISHEIILKPCFNVIRDDSVYDDNDDGDNDGDDDDDGNVDDDDDDGGSGNISDGVTCSD